MLTRASGRRRALRYATKTARHLELPFLCPILSFPHITANQQRPIATRPPPKSPKVVIQAPQSRRLASAAPSPESYMLNDDLTSYLYPHSLPLSRKNDKTLSALRAWDPTLSGMLNLDYNAISAPPARPRPGKAVDLRGSFEEIEENLEACLQLRKWPRALMTLQQLAGWYNDSDAMRQQYNIALSYMVDDMIDMHTTEVEMLITQYIEKTMRHASVQPDAQTFALVIKASLAVPQRSRRDRLVRRYWDMAARFELQAAVGALREILSERDLGLISEICPLDAQDFARYKHPSIEDASADTTSPTASEPTQYELRPTTQKGRGMTALRESLAVFSDSEISEPVFASEDSVGREMRLQERQIRLEEDSVNSAMDRWRSEHENVAKLGITAGLSKRYVRVLLWQWHELLRDKIAKEIEKCAESEAREKKTPADRIRLEYAPFLGVLSPEKMAAVTVIASMSCLNKLGVDKPAKLVRLLTDVGKYIEAEHQVSKATEDKRRWQKGTLKRGFSMVQIIRRMQYRPENVEKADGRPSLTEPPPPENTWPTSVHVKLGAVLCEFLMDVAKIRVEKVVPETGETVAIHQPAFNRSNVYVRGRRVGTVTLSDSFLEHLMREPAAETVARQLPMLCPPKPWTDFSEGAYLQSKTTVLRVKQSEVMQIGYTRAAVKNGDLDQVMSGLDVLGKVPWNINENVFRVMAEAWNSGLPVGKIAAADKEFDTPERPKADASQEEKLQWAYRMRQIANERSGNHSNRCFQNMQMEVAKAFLKETFYFPHNLDFRGRAYPIPPYLNQMSADNMRGLLLFARGRRLGSRGLRWLKIHLSNVFGYDKANLKDREQFPMDHLDEIRDAVTNGLHGQRWWLKAEDPWQCLGACHELINALDSPVPEDYISHLPVHQDGSCNGLQHYAALGGDTEGARQVNLVPGDLPADVYTGVMELVAERVAKDAAAGDEIAQLLNGRLKRKIVKQTVMTNVYGVTFIGAARQVRRQLAEYLPDLGIADIKASMYLAERIFEALGSLFTGAHAIQYWLGDCATRISRSLSPAQLEKIAAKELDRTSNEKSNDTVGVSKNGLRSLAPVSKQRLKKLRPQHASSTLENAQFRSSVIWTTPLKLPVVQPYRVVAGRSVKTNLQHVTLYEPRPSDAVDSRKQLQAFPPNFIHSLDATHMMLSALKMDELGLDFAAVHDSFWTHASEVDTLNQLLRDAFIRMHSEDVIGRLKAEFEKRYEGYLYLAKVRKGTKLARALDQHRKELSASAPHPGRGGPNKKHPNLDDELVREIQKRRLMASNDAEERRRGEEMVTPSSIFEQMSGEEDLQIIKTRGRTTEKPTSSLKKSRIESTMVQNLDSEVDVNEDAEDGFDAFTDEDMDIKKESTSRASERLWLPLTFPPLPKKGTFNVADLKDSTYFFS
jgi:DNA-directed RNA polymerase, mitochondrial